MDTPTPFLIQDRETLKVMADPLRSQILEILLDSPHTIRQTAAKLGLSASKLYYHFNLLEKHGLIEVVETRRIANLVEKHYQAVATALSWRRAAGDQYRRRQGQCQRAGDQHHRHHPRRHPAQPAGALLSVGTRRTRAPAPHGHQPPPQPPPRERRWQNFQERLCALLEEFEAADCPAGTPDTFPYAFTAALYPSFYFEETDNG